MRLMNLVLLTSTVVSAQTPKELLKLAQRTYQDPIGYQLQGRATVVPANSTWEISFDVTVAAEPTPLIDPRPSSSLGFSSDMHMKFTRIGVGDDPQPNSFILPVPVLGSWDNIADETSSVTEIGKETLPLNGVQSTCRVLEVHYVTREGFPPRQPVVYSICSEKHLVLKKTMKYPLGRRETDPPATWTVIFHTAKFGQPAPQCFVAQKDLPSVSVRKEWLGRIAPAFTIPDINGHQVALASAYGKVLLLDFWSTTCTPCIHSMPAVEAAVERQNGSVTLWGISFDPADRDKKWLSAHNKSFYTLSDTDFAVSNLYGVQGIPAIVLIGRDGKIANYWEGEVSNDELEAALRKAIRSN